MSIVDLGNAVARLNCHPVDVGWSFDIFEPGCVCETQESGLTHVLPNSITIHGKPALIALRDFLV